MTINLSEVFCKSVWRSVCLCHGFLWRPYCSVYMCIWNAYQDLYNVVYKPLNVKSGFGRFGIKWIDLCQPFWRQLIYLIQLIGCNLNKFSSGLPHFGWNGVIVKLIYSD